MTCCKSKIFTVKWVIPLQKCLQILDLQSTYSTFSGTSHFHPVCKHRLNLVAQTVIYYIRMALGLCALLGMLMDISGIFYTMAVVKHFLQLRHSLSWLYLQPLLDTMQLFCNRLIFPNDKRDQLTHNSLPVQSHCCPLRLLSLPLTPHLLFLLPLHGLPV